MKALKHEGLANFNKILTLINLHRLILVLYLSKISSNNTDIMTQTLSNYFYSEVDLPRIKFDRYGRPFIQDSLGRMMLSKSSNYNYSISK